MPVKATFGRRETGHQTKTPDPILIPRSAHSTATFVDVGTVAVDRQSAVHRSTHGTEWPFVSTALIGLLCLIFWLEIDFATLSPSRHDLMALGAVDGQLVFGAQEWWRVFTAPLLHGSLMHLMGNSIALFFAGACLESLIGAAWFAALFAIAALGGVAGSLAINGASTVSVGASGAIMGLLTAAVLCSSRIAETKRRFRMQLVAGRILVPSLLPAFFPAAAMAGHIDYGAHLGGAIAGVAIAVFLKSIWDEQTNRPALQQTATVILATGAAVTILAFSIATAHRGVHVSEPVTLIPEREIPKTNAEGISRSADLVTRFPDDPRARFYRAIYFMKERDLSDAGTQLRAAVEAFSSHADDFEPQFGQTLKLTLALILAQQGDTSEARGMAQDSCTSTAPEVKSVLQSLREHGICG